MKLRINLPEGPFVIVDASYVAWDGDGISFLSADGIVLLRLPGRSMVRVETVDQIDNATPLT